MPLWSFSQNNIARHQVGIEIPEVALLALVSENQHDIQLNMSSPTEAGNAINASGAENKSIWINYSSVIKEAEHNRKVVAMVQGEIPDGMQLMVEASNATGSGNGKFGEPAGRVELTNRPVDVITNIGSCYTGKGINNGHILSYKLEFDKANSNYTNLNQNQTTVNVIYTLTDNN